MEDDTAVRSKGTLKGAPLPDRPRGVTFWAFEKPSQDAVLSRQEGTY